MTNEMPPSRAKRRWPWIVGGVVALIGVVVALFAFLALFVIIGSGGGESDPPTPDASVTVSRAPATVVASTDHLSLFFDVNADAPWMDRVTGLTETEPGQLQVNSDLVDPGGAAGGSEAATAILICEAVVALSPDVTHVSVMEADGTQFVLFGNPSYPDGCTEV